MSKGSSNLKSKKSHTSKPYDVSQSFVAKVASRVSELLPQRTWLNRWLSPDVDVHHHHVAGSHALPQTSTPMVNSHHATVSPDQYEYGPGPSKRPRLPFNSPPVFLHNKFLSNTPIHEEEISPIGPATVPINDSAVAGPSGLCQFNQKSNFTPTSSGSGVDPSQLKLGDKLTAATQRSSTTNDKLNGGDDCSETSESTSGCSSLVPQAQTSQSRRSEARHLNFPAKRICTSGLDRSLFPSRSSTKVDLSSLDRRRPSFDTTTFTSSSRLMNISSNPNQTSSPFYSGRTMYGGASGYNTSGSSGLFSQTPRRLGVTVRPVNVNSPSEPALSTTAKKILDALEQFSTPVVDAKRLPITPGSKRKLERYAELHLPTTSDLLRVKRKERLQKSTSAARQASLSSSHQDSELSAKSGPSEYRLRNDDSEAEKHTSKIIHRHKGLETDTRLVEVNLPTAVLPIKTLPKIDIPIPPCPKTIPAVTVSHAAGIGTVRNTTASTGVSSSGMLDKEFKMSAPLPVQADNRTSLLGTDNFKFVFSEPIGPNSKKETAGGFSFSNSNNNKDNSNSTFSFLNAMSDNKSKSVGNTFSLGFNKSDIGSSDIKTVESTIKKTKPFDSSSSSSSTTTVTTSSVTNSNNKSSTPDNNGYWKCSMCIVRNSNDINTCIACGTKKITSAAVTSSSPLVFKPPPDTWECKECFIRNKNSVTVCVACDSPKTANKTVVSSSSPLVKTPASTIPESVKITNNAVSTSISSVTSTTVTAGFGDKFKMPSDVQECKEDKSISDKAMSPSSAKPGANFTSKQPASTVTTGFGDMFKKPEGSWDCGMCMIRNDGKSLKCVACETPKPGAAKEATTAASSSITSCGFTFGIPATPTGGTGFSIPSSVGTGLSNKDENKTVAGFQFGGSSSSASTNISANFTFGIPPAKPTVNDTDNSPKEKKIKTSINDKLPSPLQELAKLQEKQSGSSPSTFKLGVNHDKAKEKQETNQDKPVANKNLFSSVDANKSSSNFTSDKSTDNMFKNKNEVPSTAFSFGSSASQEKTDSNANKTSNFLFQPKMDQPASSVKNSLFGNLTNKTTQSETKTTLQSELFSVGSNASTTNLGFSTASTTATTFTTATKSNMNSIFTFGSASSTDEDKSGIVFGSGSNDNVQKPALSVAEAKCVFSASKEAPLIFGNVKPEIKPPVFGGSIVNDTKPVLSSGLSNSTNVPTFAAPASSNTSTGSSLQGSFKSETPAVSAPSFQAFASSAPAPSRFQSQSLAPQQPEKSLFGMASANPSIQTGTTTQSGGFSFGSSTPVTNNDQVKQPFAFGSSQAPSSGFSFTPTSTTPAQNFNFAPKEAESSAGFNFSSVAPVQNNQAAAPVFGSQITAPSFGSNPTPNNIFAFGSQSAQAQPSSGSHMFGFNNSQASTPAPNAFGFGTPNTDTNQTPAAVTAVPAFDPNARPTFNFTGGSAISFTITKRVLYVREEHCCVIIASNSLGGVKLPELDCLMDVEE